MVRSPRSEEMGLRRGKWTVEEDQKLISYINRYGIWNWNEMPKPAGLLRSGKSCRLRWLNYLKPGIKLGNFSKEEEETILKLRDSMGNKWSAIAARLPGRTDNEIKNLWNTRLKKQLCDKPLPRPASKEVEFTSYASKEVEFTSYHTKLSNINSPSSASTHESEPFSSSTEVSTHKDSMYIPVPSPYSFTADCSSWDADSGAVVNEQHLTREVRNWMSQTFLELPSFWEQPFILDDDELQATYLESQCYMPPTPQVWYQEPVTPCGGYATDLW